MKQKKSFKENDIPPKVPPSCSRDGDVARDSLETEAPISRWTLPFDALVFEPSYRDIIDGGVRYIYLNTPLTEEEQSLIRNLREYLISIGMVLPEFMASQYLRFLYSSNFNMKEAAQLLEANYRFRASQLPFRERDVIQDLKRGAIYWHGRDANLRPLLVIRVERLDALDDKRIERLLCFCFEYFLKYLCVAGRVENWILLIDCEGKGVSNFPTTTLQTVMATMNTRYRGRLYRLLVVNIPTWMGWLSSWVTSLVPATSAKKMKVLGSDFKKTMREIFSSHQIEARYGGTAPDLLRDFYPFRFFKGPFQPESKSTVVNISPLEYLHEKVDPRVMSGNSWELAEDVPLDCVEWIRTIDRDMLTVRSCKWLLRLGVNAQPVCSLEGVMAKIKLQKADSSHSLADSFGTTSLSCWDFT